MYNLDTNTKNQINDFLSPFFSEKVIKQIIKNKRIKFSKASTKKEFIKKVKTSIIRIKKQQENIKRKERISKKLFKNKGDIKEKNTLVKTDNKPVFISEKSTKFKFLTKFLYTFDNVKDLKGLFDAIVQIMEKTEKEEEGTPTAFIFYYKNIETGKIRAITITTEKFYNPLDLDESFKDFKKALDDIEKGRVVGSDGILVKENTLILNTFGALRVNIIGKGKSDKMLFKTEKIESNGFCGYEVLKKCGIYYDDNKKKLQDFNIFKNIIREENKKGRRIHIISNSFRLKCDKITIMKEEGTIKKSIIDNRGNTNNIICTKLKDKHIYIDYLNKYKEDEKEQLERINNENELNEEDKYIIYDDINQHYDIIKDNKIELEEDIYLTASNKVIKNDLVIFTPQQIKNNQIEEPKNIKFEYLFFDYETIIDFNYNNCMREYSLSILHLNKNELAELNEADKENNIEKVNEIRKNKCVTFLGYDCSEQFIKWVNNNQDNKLYMLIGFNNSNYDNFILLDALLKENINNINIENGVSNIFYNNNSLLNFTFNGRHNFFDIRKHLTGRLKDCCKSFKINVCSKLDFDHNKAQKLHEENKLNEFINNNEELKKYNEFDVLATSILFYRYQESLINIDITKKYGDNLFEHKTIGNIIYNVFQDNKQNKNIELPELNINQYQDLQKYKIAGRVEMFNGVQKVNERLVSTDVCSLYPYVMSVLNVYYPCGEIKETNKYIKDKIGFYYCDIDQSNLKNNNLPNIYAFKSETENDWGTQEILKDYLISNVMIDLLLKHNCKVDIKKGFYFTKKIKSCDLFGFLLDLMKEKNKQDDFKNNNDGKYNSALRETLKLLMNSLSGKVIEGLHTETITEVDNIFEYEKIKKKAVKMNTINLINNKIFVSYEVEPEKILKKQRPIYLGVLIYDYAKKYMFENSYSKIGLNKLLYTDTDATKFRYSDFLKWKEEINKNNIIVPHWEEVEKVDERYKTHKIYEDNSKVFGSFEDELKEIESTTNEYYFYCLQKKSWLYGCENPINKKYKEKFRFKGLNPNSQLINKNNDIITTLTTKKETKYIINIKEKDIYNYYENNKNNSLENNAKDFFEEVYKNKNALILCSSFRRIVKNSLHNVDIEDEERFNKKINRIQANIILKEIKI